MRFAVRPANVNSSFQTAPVLLLSGHQALMRGSGDKISLPRLQVRPHRRPAEEMTSAIREAWGTEAVVLFRSSSSVYIAESISAPLKSSCDYNWVSRRELVDNYLLESDRILLQESLRQLERFGDQPDAPFAQLGWFRHLLQWIEDRVPGVSPSVCYRQLNAGPQFTLIRLDMSLGALWFKATGGPYAKECRITLHLAELCPGFIAPPIAHHCAWNGWLSHEVEGHLLCDLPSCAAWRLVGDQLAQLQLTSSSHILSLLADGCLDLRASALRRDLDDFIEVFRRSASSEETSNVAEQRLRDTLLGAIEGMEATELPACLNHMDPNPENLLLTDERCVFLDWAGAGISSPLLSLEYLLRHCMGVSGALENREALSEGYMRRWSEGFASEALLKAKRHSARLAAYAFLTSQVNWRESEAPDQARTFVRICRFIFGSADQVREGVGR